MLVGFCFIMCVTVSFFFLVANSVSNVRASERNRNGPFVLSSICFGTQIGSTVFIDLEVPLGIWVSV